jgi:hypothetical protein
MQQMVGRHWEKQHSAGQQFIGQQMVGRQLIIVPKNQPRMAADSHLHRQQLVSNNFSLKSCCFAK